MILGGHVSVRNQGHGRWCGFRETSDKIPVIMGHAFLLTALLSGILLAYLLQAFHGLWQLLCNVALSPQSLLLCQDSPAFSGD